MATTQAEQLTWNLKATVHGNISYKTHLEGYSHLNLTNLLWIKSMYQFQWGRSMLLV